MYVLGEESVVGKLHAHAVNHSGQTERRPEGGEMLQEGGDTDECVCVRMSE